MDLTTILAAAGSAKDLASLLISMKVDNAVINKAIDLQNSIIALQSDLLQKQAQLQDLETKNQALQAQLAAVQDWKAEDEAHHYITVAKGVHVVMRKGSDLTSGMSVWYCTNCWEKRFKSVLQRTTQDFDGTHYCCPNCDAKVNDHSERMQLSL